VLSAEKNAKFRSNLTEADQYIAENAIPNEDLREDTNLAMVLFVNSHSFLFPTF